MFFSFFKIKESAKEMEGESRANASKFSQYH